MNVPYKVHKEQDIKAETSDKNKRCVLFQSGFYKCILVINPFYCDYRKTNNSILGHLEFYALSEGWEKYTSTGYRSTFFHHLNIKQYQNDDFVAQEFKKMLEKDGFLFEESIQVTLF